MRSRNLRKKTNLKTIVSDEGEKDFCYNRKEEARGQSSAATVWRCERKAEKRQTQSAKSRR